MLAIKLWRLKLADVFYLRYDIVEASEEKVEEDCFEEHDVLRSHRNDPMSKDQFKRLFDESGRLVNEHELRRAIFKGNTATPKTCQGIFWCKF